MKNALLKCPSKKLAMKLQENANAVKEALPVLENSAMLPLKQWYGQY